MIARKILVNPDVTPLCYCITRCVRRAFLCGQVNAHCKLWIEEHLQELMTIFALVVCGLLMMDNHIHLLLRFELPRARAWIADAVVRRWLLLCPPKDHFGKPIVVVAARLVERPRGFN